MRWLILVTWVGVQPWVRWPALSFDVSHRLTLLGCTLAAWLYALWYGERHPLPRTWVMWVGYFLAVAGYGFLPVVQEGDYFHAFLETGAMANGVAVVLACTAGLWGLTQWPVHELRAARWIGLAVLEVSLIVALAQWWLGTQHATGVLHLDRAMAAYAVGWLPICWTWHPGVAIIPGLLVILARKPLAFLAAAAAMWPLLGRKARVIAVVVSTALCLLAYPPYMVVGRVLPRVQTWWHALQASWDHLFVGWGFSPMVLTNIQTHYGYLLPSLHSDWLMLAVGAGWVVAVSAAWLMWKVISTKPRTSWARALQGSLLGLAVLSAVQSTVSHARVGGLALFLLAWWVVEQREGAQHA